jgi:hypothetical protein
VSLNVLELSAMVAGPTRLELATSGVTGRRSNQLNYDPAWVLLPRVLLSFARTADEVLLANRSSHRSFSPAFARSARRATFA